MAKAKKSEQPATDAVAPEAEPVPAADEPQPEGTSEGFPRAEDPIAHPEYRDPARTRQEHDPKAGDRKWRTDMEETVEAMAGQLAKLTLAVGTMQVQIEKLEASRPPVALTSEQVRTIIAAEPYAMFRVLAPWMNAAVGEFRADQEIRADQYPHLAGYVQTGLRIVRGPRS